MNLDISCPLNLSHDFEYRFLSPPPPAPPPSYLLLSFDLFPPFFPFLVFSLVGSPTSSLLKYDLEHVVDEVSAGWYDRCVLPGPQVRPDLAIGLFSSAFNDNENEIDKLQRYTSVDSWTQVTTTMYFPFLTCEVECGNLDMADRQNMHSCSVAVRALLRIEQEADKYRPETKTDRLEGQVLVCSISHDQQDARLYGHCAQVHREKWTYFRYQVQIFNLSKREGLLAIHNAVRNILKL